jgi:putative restriction endonuclease
MPDRDEPVRLAAFGYLDRQRAIHGDALPYSVLKAGFEFEGQRVHLIGPEGIFAPAGFDIPLTLKTAPEVSGRPRPYEDEWIENELLRYRYRGMDPQHPDNVGLRRAMAERIPLIYLDGVERGRYHAIYPVYVIEDDPASLSFTVADSSTSAAHVAGVASEGELERRYATRLTRQRLHQVAFRNRVITAYREVCAICRLQQRALLDAAHIIRDAAEEGRPVISNGLSLCKLHHAAFDVNIIGIRPDLIVELRRDVLEQHDGPMLVHGLQGFQGGLLQVPRRPEWRPDSAALEQRYDEFRAVG